MDTLRDSDHEQYDRCDRNRPRCHASEQHFEVRGTGGPVVFLHGGTVDFQSNYAALGWPETFSPDGLQLIGLDFRGHGKSDKPHGAFAAILRANK